MKLIKGFTLIEIMITIAIVGIIASIAYPSYMESVRKSNRAEAKTELLDVSQRLQRCYTSLARFDDKDNCPVYKILDGGTYVTRGSGFYRITITHPGNPRTTYQLKATAIKSPQIKDTRDGCNELTLEHTGVQLPDVCW
jgi:type IV pilus assembly protein PilE